jgi:hypothetical protein
VILERLARRNRVVPAVEVRRRRAAGHQLAVAVAHDADRNVAVGEGIAGEEFCFRQLRVHDLHGGDGFVLRGLDRRQVALFFRRADQPPERRRDRGAHHRQLPIHPLAGERARFRILRLQHACLVVLAGEVAYDGVGLPQQEAVFFLQRRYQAVGIHRQIFWLLVLAERAADVDALAFELELVHRPHRLLYVGRGVAAPDFDHGRFLSSRTVMPRERGASSTPCVGL